MKQCSCQPLLDSLLMSHLQVASVLSTSASQGSVSFLDATGAGLSAAGNRLQQVCEYPIWQTSEKCSPVFFGLFPWRPPTT